MCSSLTSKASFAEGILGSAGIPAIKRKAATTVAGSLSKCNNCSSDGRALAVQIGRAEIAHLAVRFLLVLLYLHYGPFAHHLIDVSEIVV